MTGSTSLLTNEDRLVQHRLDTGLVDLATSWHKLQMSLASAVFVFRFVFLFDRKDRAIGRADSFHGIYSWNISRRDLSIFELYHTTASQTKRPQLLLSYRQFISTHHQAFVFLGSMIESQITPS